MRVLMVEDRHGAVDAAPPVPLDGTWEIVRADDAGRALKELARRDGIDVVVADDALRGGGPQLLRDVRRLRPHAVRILLGDADTPDHRLRAATVAHRCLPQPLARDAVVETIARVGRLRDELAAPAIVASIADASALPPTPTTYLRLLDALQDPAVGGPEVAEIVREDAALAARVITLANGAPFRPLRDLDDIRMAVMSLGVRTIRHLVLAGEVFAAAGDDAVVAKRQRDALIASMLAPAIFGRWADAELARAAALLANVGALVDGVSLAAPSHATVGAALLARWGLPEAVVEAVARHHDPAGANGEARFGLAGAVHVATALTGDGEIDAAYLARCGLVPKLDDWREHRDELIATA